MRWWSRFPPGLRNVTARLGLLASIGAGGVIFMTPLIFRAIDFSASQVGSGLAVSALIGTAVRLTSVGRCWIGAFAAHGRCAAPPCWRCWLI